MTEGDWYRRKLEISDTAHLTMSRHVDRGLGGNGILTAPETGDSLVLGVERQTWLSVKGARSSTSDTLLVACEAEHGQWDRDWSEHRQHLFYTNESG